MSKQWQAYAHHVIEAIEKNRPYDCEIGRDKPSSAFAGLCQDNVAKDP